MMHAWHWFLASAEAGAHAVPEQVGAIFGLLLIAGAVLAICKRFSLPFTVLLVLSGLGIHQLALQFEGNAFLDGIANYRISPEMILFVFLPTLVFESAYNLHARQLQKNMLPVLTLAIPGLLLSTGIIGGLLAWLTDIPLAPALLLGSILSATDPVAVIALFKQLGAPKRLTVLVEGESLFNDATSIVVAGILIEVVRQGFDTSTLTTGLFDFFRVFLGGIAVGLLLGFLFGTLLQRVRSDEAIEISLTMILAYGSFLIAEHYLHVSGVMATVMAGLMMGNWGRTKISPAVSGFMHHFWEFAAYVANALIFLLVGLSVDLEQLQLLSGVLAVVVGTMLLSRAVVIFGLVPIAGRMAQPVSKAFQLVMYWGGLRGAIALAIALHIPDNVVVDGAEVPLNITINDTTLLLRDCFITLVMGAVLFTLLVQATTIGKLVRKLGLDKPSIAERVAKISSLTNSKYRALKRIPELQAGGLFSTNVADPLRDRTQQELDDLNGQIATLRRDELNREQERQLLFLRCFALETNAYYDMFSKRHLSERVYRDLTFSLELLGEAMKHDGSLLSATIYDERRQRLRQRIFKMLSKLPGLSAWIRQVNTQRTSREYRRVWGRYQGSEAVLEDLAVLADSEHAHKEVVDEVRQQYQKWHDSARERLDSVAEQFPEFVHTMQEQLAERLIAQAQREVIQKEAKSGAIPQGVATEVLSHLDDHVHRIGNQALEQLHVNPEELLRKVPFFSETPPNEFAKVAGKLREQTVPSGEDIIQEGDAGDSLFLIARGVIRVVKEIDGESVELATLVAGEFFGEMALLLREPRNATCRAVTPCALYELKRDDLDEIQSACPAIKDALMKTAAERSS